MRPTLKAVAPTRTVWGTAALRWTWRIGRALILAAAVLIIVRGGRPAPPDTTSPADMRAALAVAGHLNATAAPVGHDLGGDPIVRTSDKGCWTVGADSAGTPIWPPSPITCPGGGGELVAVDADVPGTPVPAPVRDAVVGWVGQVLDGGTPERWTQTGVESPTGPWVRHLTNPQTSVTDVGGGFYFAQVSADWAGAPFDAGWKVTVAPRGDAYEIASVAPATSGTAPPDPPTTTIPTTTSTKGADAS